MSILEQRPEMLLFTESVQYSCPPTHSVVGCSLVSAVALPPFDISMETIALY